MEIINSRQLAIQSNSRSAKSIILKRIVFVTLAILLLFEVFSGALRYYLSVWGFVSLYYLPKILCLALIFFRIFSFRVQHFLPIALILFSSGIAIYNGASYFNVGFSLFLYTPLFFALLFGNDFDLDSNSFINLLIWCYLLSVLGIFLDYLTVVPWKGFNYVVGDVEVVGNRQWTAFGKDRIAGFARVSSALALLLVSLAVYLSVYIKSRINNLLLIVLTISCIFLTTNKTTLPAYIIGLLIIWFKDSNLKVYLISIVLLGLTLPFITILFDINFIEEISRNKDTEMTFSLNDRIENTWPNFYNNVIKIGSGVVGLGFGATGGSVILFPISEYKKLKGSLGGADNTALYLWGMLGIVGIFLYYNLFWMMNKLKSINRSYATALLGTISCICVVSWTTDILETTSGCLFIGTGVAVIFKKIGYTLNYKK